MNLAAKLCTAAAVSASSMAHAAPPVDSTRSSAERGGYRVYQLSVDSREVPFEQFKAEIEPIAKCSDAKTVAKKIKADVRSGRSLSEPQLTQDLADQLEQLRIGETTDIFTNDGVTLRVLVLCGRG